MPQPNEGGGPCDHERGLVEDERQDEGLVQGQAKGDARRRMPELGRPIGVAVLFEAGMGAARPLGRWQCACEKTFILEAGCVAGEDNYSFWRLAVLPAAGRCRRWTCRPLALLPA